MDQYHISPKLLPLVKYHVASIVTVRTNSDSFGQENDRSEDFKGKYMLLGRKEEKARLLASATRHSWAGGTKN